jgi:osmotically-inducible protein OsmY
MLDSIRSRKRKQVARANTRKLRLLIIGGGTAALLVYLFDPDRGKTRRTQMKDRIGGLLRTAQQRAGRTGRRAASDVAGFKDRVIHAGDTAPPNDPALAAKVESEVMGRYPQLSINVNAQHGVIGLRGEVSTEDLRSEIEQAVRKVTGVIDVDNLLHLPGQPPPSK